MIWQYVIGLFAGVGVFIAGMNMMSDGLTRSAGKGMKSLLAKIGKNRLSGVGVGAGVTAIIQSSAATTVMAIGFVNAGIMTLAQATSIIMGANIGTTVTGMIVSLKSLNISLYATLLAFIGVMMTFLKSDKIKNVGNILCGLGIIFIGLDLMSEAFGGPEVKSFLQNLFNAIDFPLLLILVGMLVTALIQSSSASTGIVIIMVAEGALSLGNALFIILGSNIGTCVTALIASIGTSVNARRTAVIHLMFNVIGTVIFTALLWPFVDQFTVLLTSLVSTPAMQTAWFHVIFNVTTTLILLPFIKQLVSVAQHLVKEKVNPEDELKLRFVDDRLLMTPSVALMQTKKEIEHMANLAKQNIERSYVEFSRGDGSLVKDIVRTESVIDFTNKELTKFLIKLTAHVTEGEEKVIGSYFHVLNDLERIGDHAENFMDMGVQMRENELTFSESAMNELETMYQEVIAMFNIALEAFDNTDSTHLSELTERENVVDGMKKTLNSNHVQRMAVGNCSSDLSAYFFSTVAGLERVADHLVNVGYSILNPTGSQKA